jgi:NADPH:quinone reductase-like Zn-dependent oxidoreductase
MINPTTIKALAIQGFDGSPTVIDVPAPEPGQDEVLVRVGAASVNAFDIAVAMGMMKDFMSYEFPAVLGRDLAGVVEATGADVEGFTEGDRVFGTIGQKGFVRDGTFAEVSTPQASGLALTPEGVDDEQAGSLGVAGTTAMSAVEALDPSGGSTVLVVGATGGVGTFVAQLAAARGARVIASALPGDEDFVMGLGAAETVDYTNDLAATVRERYPDGVDALVDLVNRDAAAFAALAALVRAGGRAASAEGGAGEATEIGEVSVSDVGGDPIHLEALAAMMAEAASRHPAPVPARRRSSGARRLHKRAHPRQARHHDLRRLTLGRNRPVRSAYAVYSSPKRRCSSPSSFRTSVVINTGPSNSV